MKHLTQIAQRGYRVSFLGDTQKLDKTLSCLLWVTLLGAAGAGQVHGVPHHPAGGAAAAAVPALWGGGLSAGAGRVRGKELLFPRRGDTIETRTGSGPPHFHQIKIRGVP